VKIYLISKGLKTKEAFNPLSAKICERALTFLLPHPYHFSISLTCGFALTEWRIFMSCMPVIWHLKG